MYRYWTFPPSRILDGLLVLFALNALLVAWSIIARHAWADAPQPAQQVAESQFTAEERDEGSSSPASDPQPANDTEQVGNSSQASAAEQPGKNETSDQATAEITDDTSVDAESAQPLSNRIAIPDPAALTDLSDLPPTPSLDSLKNNPDFREFQKLAKEHFPAPELSLLSEDATAAEQLASESDASSFGSNAPQVASEELRELEERLLVVDHLNAAALRLARMAHRHAAANRTDACKRALAQSQQLQTIAKELLGAQ